MLTPSTAIYPGSYKTLLNKTMKHTHDGSGTGETFFFKKKIKTNFRMTTDDAGAILQNYITYYEMQDNVVWAYTTYGMNSTLSFRMWYTDD